MAVKNPPPPVDFDAARIDKGPLTPLQLKREAIVREHMDTENRHEVEPAIATFADRPRYELYSTGPPTARAPALRRGSPFRVDSEAVACRVRTVRSRRAAP